LAGKSDDPSTPEKNSLAAKEGGVHMNLKAQAKAALCFGAILALSFCPTARADDIPAGSDYFMTEPGTQFVFDGVTVPLMGVPIGPGLTDTIVQRTSDAIVSPGGVASPITIQIDALSLESTTPIPGIGTVFVTLDPDNLANDTGQLTLAENSTGTGGTFTSFFDVFFDVCLQPGANGVGCASGTSPIGTGEVTLSNSGANWSTTPVLGYVGPPGNFFPGDSNGTPSPITETCLPGTTPPCGPPATHNVDPATTPEPSSLALWATGLVVVGLFGKKFFTAA
jgi:hypothetical protein